MYTLKRVLTHFYRYRVFKITILLKHFFYRVFADIYFVYFLRLVSFWTSCCLRKSNHFQILFKLMCWVVFSLLGFFLLVKHGHVRTQAYTFHQTLFPPTFDVHLTCFLFIVSYSFLVYSFLLRQIFFFIVVIFSLCFFSLFSSYDCCIFIVFIYS